jgi:hypothetical protein
MALTKLVVLAHFDVEGGPSPKLSETRPLVVVEPHVASLELTTLQAATAEDGQDGCGETVAPAKKK